MACNLKNETLMRNARLDWPSWAFKRVAPFVWLILMLGGCAFDMNIHVGRRPNLDAIEQRLRPGQSTTDDVLAALGPPRGRGRAMLPIDPAQRDMWSYSYLQANVQKGGETQGDMRTLILFIYFEQDRYMGYMWFSSLVD